MNIRVAAAAREPDSEVTLLPRREEPDWLALQFQRFGLNGFGTE
jgi:hypothetical protein